MRRVNWVKDAWNLRRRNRQADKTESSATDLPRSAAVHKTIRGQILLAFVTMSVITGSLGYFALRGLEREGALVDRTFDRSLMSINFARAAAADFKQLQAIATRRAFTEDAASKASLDSEIAEVEAEMADDLSVAVDRAQSQRALVAARKVVAAAADWKAAQRDTAAAAHSKSAWAVFDRQASRVSQELDLLINYTAGDGFTYRQKAHGEILGERRFNLAATTLAVLLSGLIAWLLSRRVVVPIEKASDIARKIAAGDLDVTVPAGNADELGRLLAAMDVMRGNIKSSMAREVDLRRSAQTRLAAALEGSCEGIVVVDAKDEIVLANAQASRLLEADERPLGPGQTAERLARLVESDEVDPSAFRDIELASGRWLRISRSRTQEGGFVFVYSDVSLVKEQQAALTRANFWLDAALANLTHGLCLFGPNNRLKVFNGRYCELFGLAPDLVRQGMSLDELIDVGVACGNVLQTKDEIQETVRQRVEAGIDNEHMYRLVNGRSIAVSHRPLQDGSWLATYEDVTDRLRAAEAIEHMARHDALTGLPNRAFFAERIEIALAAAERGHGFALLCLDLDRFKEVNDTLGHPVGDQLLIEVAGRLRTATRESDLVARLGGDEFAIIQMLRDTDEATALARRIVAALNVPFEIAGHSISIGVSIGISTASDCGISYDSLLKNADIALYRAKSDGRNVWRLFEQAMDERQRARREIELELREALERDQFELDYQPIVDLDSGRITSFEALLRWHHATRGIVPPSEFIPIAEEMGLISQIGDKALRRACLDAAGWPSDVSIAVNVSASQLHDGALLESVAAALDRSGLSPDRLILEITESVLIANAQQARLVLDPCKAMGIRIAMDDFGTGYSSLSYLRSFPFDQVKIDESFVRDVARPEAAAIVRAVIALCASLDMRAIAEGVETDAQRDFLKAEGCLEAQGFLFSKPVASRAVPGLLRAPRQSFVMKAETRAA